MEPSTNGAGGGANNKSGTNFLCKQTNTRWTPTTDQIRILKELYYNNGVRSPTAEQIQKISARLRHFGKIEGKNVFYWFQNHKARERQKKRFTPTSENPIHIPHIMHHSLLGAPPHSSGHFTMENSFRECSISAACNGGSKKSGVDPYYHYPSYGCAEQSSSFRGSYDFYHHGGENEEEASSPPGMETLPLFPMHGEDFLRSSNSSGASDAQGYYTYSDGRSSLELSLCSFAAADS